MNKENGMIRWLIGKWVKKGVDEALAENRSAIDEIAERAYRCGIIFAGNPAWGMPPKTYKEALGIMRSVMARKKA